MRHQGKICEWKVDRGFGFIVGLTPKGNEALPQMAAALSFDIRMEEALRKRFLITGTMLPLKEAIAIASKAM